MNTSITSHTQLYTLIGNPVSHSISPVIQNSIFSAKQCSNSKYIALNVAPGEFDESIPLLKHNFKGLNVTIPHKQTIMKHLDVIDEKALLCGAVNTVKNDNGRLIGYNTDGYGFMKAFEYLNRAPKDVLLIGAGGAARAVLCELLQRGCHVTIINRTPEKALRLQRELSKSFSGSIKMIDNYTQLQAHYDCLVNATPIGMYPKVNNSPIDEQYLEHFSLVYDLIYNPHETKLLTDAKRHGCKIVNGLQMLFYQAIEANRIWTDLSLPYQLELELYEKTVEYLQKM